MTVLRWVAGGLLAVGVAAGAAHLVTLERSPPRWRVAGEVPVADGFDFPVNPPDAGGYRDAQPFGTNRHLGSDWSTVLAAQGCLGAPVHAIAIGQVTEADDLGGGWGKVVRIAHRVRDRAGERRVESLYAHLDRIDVAPGTRVGRGHRIGTIGTAGGRYRPHLHLELRDGVGLPLGGGYGRSAVHLDPTAFIRAHRPQDR